MRYIKSYKIFESIDLELGKELEKFNITKYSINEDGSIDVDGIVDFGSKNLNKIPFNFNRVSNYFDVNDNKLTSLKNCPVQIDEWFGCGNNKLTSLEFGPEYIGSEYFCSNNELITLNGCIEEVHGNFECNDNKLTTLEFCPMEIGGDFDCSGNKLEYLDRSPMIKGTLFCYDMFDEKPEFNGSCRKLCWS